MTGEEFFAKKGASKGAAAFMNSAGQMTKTLQFRLTLWHTLTFGGMALLVFGFAYFTVSRQLLAAIEEDLQDTATEFSDLYQTGGIKALQAEINREARSHGDNRFAARYISATGQPLVANVPTSWRLPLPMPEETRAETQWFEAPVNLQGDLAKLIAIPTKDHGWIQVGLSLHEHEVQLQKVRWGFGWTLLVIVLAGIGTGWWQVRRALAGVDQVRKAAIEIGEGAFDQRLELEGHGQELIDLAEAFNIMLDRIQRLLTEMQDVSDNIAHDLRSPVARIRGIAEAGLMSAGDDSSPENRETLATIINECDRLTSMINTMLEIAQTNAGVVHLERNTVDVRYLLNEACDLFEPVAQQHDIELKSDIKEPHLVVKGDNPRLQRLIANLIDNAIKFSSKGDNVTVAADLSESRVHFTVTDTGQGISEEDIPHIFDRFYRSDKSRNAPGNGLGLSYAKSIVEAHGGEIHVESKIGHGTTVMVSLPRGQDDQMVM